MWSVLNPGLHGSDRDRAPTLQDQWRAINLFGRNVASYKFALAEALLSIRPTADTLVRMEELAKPFAFAVCRHLKIEDKQATSASSAFLNACRMFNQGEMDEAKLVATTISKGFNNVIDAFHVVGQADVPNRFFNDERATTEGIRITENFSKLLETYSAVDLPGEVEARWRLVETAWAVGLPKAMVAAYDIETGALVMPGRGTRRVAVTTGRPALNGYQQGRCFYCSYPISTVPGENLAEVDHFFPFSLWPLAGDAVNGVWNLVLACAACNRGSGGKFAAVPDFDLLHRLHDRNEYLIGSHHPLRETLIQQTGGTEAARMTYLRDFDRLAIRHLIHRWRPRH